MDTIIFGGARSGKSVAKAMELLSCMHRLEDGEAMAALINGRRFRIEAARKPEAEDTQQAEPATPSHTLPGELVEAAREVLMWADIRDENGDELGRGWDADFNRLDAALSLPLPTVEQVRAEYLEELIQRFERETDETVSWIGATEQEGGTATPEEVQRARSLRATAEALRSIQKSEDTP